jgi:pyridoxal phosphate enzyme (YggS family)
LLERALVVEVGSNIEAASDGRVAAVTTCRADTVASRLEDVRRRVGDAGADPDQVRIVAVTKGFGPDAVDAAMIAGLRDVGENYAQELLAKAENSNAGARWHFLGHIQRNKVRGLAPIVRTWHAVDRIAAAQSVADAGPGAEVMIQVNVIGAPSKPGCPPDDVDDLVTRCRLLPLDVSGLMAVGPAGDVEGTRKCFRWLAERARRLGLRELSMGMSDDYEIAIAEGATTLRLGRVIFGPRPGRAAVQR